jgi:hypothetical protein
MKFFATQIKVWSTCFLLTLGLLFPSAAQVNRPVLVKTNDYTVVYPTNFWQFVEATNLFFYNYIGSVSNRFDAFSVALTNQANANSVAASNLSYAIGTAATNYAKSTTNGIMPANGVGMLTNDGSGVKGWMAIPSGGGGGSGLTTNNNQFGASVQLTIKDGAQFTNTVINTKQGGVDPALSLYNAPGDVANLLSSLDDDSSTTLVIDNNHVFTLRAAAASGYDPTAVFDNIGGSGQTITTWRVGGTDSAIMRADSSGNMVMGPAPAATGGMFFNYDGGDGEVHFGLSGVGDLFSIIPDATVAQIIGGTARRAQITNVWDIWSRTNVWISKTNLTDGLIVTNTVRFLGHNVASNALWVATNATTGEGEWRGNLALLQPASANLTNWSGTATGLWVTVTGGTFLTNWTDAVSNQLNLFSVALTNQGNANSVAASNLSYVIGSNATNHTGSILQSATNYANTITTNMVKNKDGTATNLTVQGLTVNTNLTLSHVTALRPAFINGSGQVTNASGTPDGTKFMRDDGVLATPSAVATAGGFSGAIQFNESATIAGTNDLNWDRTNRVLNFKGVIASTLDAAPSNSLAYFTASTNDYLQINVRNSSSGTGAESGYAATADTGTELAGFAWMGINSSTFSAVRSYSLGLANDVTFIGSGNDMEFGNANTNRDMIFSMGTAGTPFWQERMRLKSTTQGGGLGLIAGLSTSNAWVGGKIIDVKGLAFTNHSAVFSLTNAYTNATLIAANMLTNQGDTVICEWTIAHRRPANATNVFQVVYGSQIIFNSGLMNYSNGMSIVSQRITRGSSGTEQYCEGQVSPFQSIVSAIGRTNLFTAAQSNWIATPIGLRFSSSGAQLLTNVAFRMYYEPATR